MSGRLARAMATEERVPRAAADAGAADMADEDAESLAAALAGDEQAFARIYRRWQGPLYRFTLHMSGSESLAEDVTQEVFVMLAQRGDRFDPGKGRFSSYAFAIARNLLRRRLRREGIYAAMADEATAGDAPTEAAAARPAMGALADDPALAPDRAFDRQQTVARVRRAICLLPVAFREAIVLCDLQDLSYADAAAIVGCPVGTVRSRLHRGRQLLAERLRAVMKGPDDSMPGEGRTDDGR